MRTRGRVGIDGKREEIVSRKFLTKNLLLTKKKGMGIKIKYSENLKKMYRERNELSGMEKESVILRFRI